MVGANLSPHTHRRAQPGYTARFAEQLETLGARVPLTTYPQLWAEAVELGRRVLWLHTYGDRHIDSAASRPVGPGRRRGRGS